MIVYLDTSALIKLYVAEEHSALMRRTVLQAETVATHAISYLETRAAFARLARDAAISHRHHETITREFQIDWPNYAQLQVSQTLLERAAELAQAFALRAYDSLHLAAADFLRRQINEPALFACFDRKLNRAAKVIELAVLDVAA
jgi:predicted nucleic acid-binding protein